MKGAELFEEVKGKLDNREMNGGRVHTEECMVIVWRERA